MKYELGFLGAGNMAEAIARAAMRGGVLEAAQMIAADPSDTRRGVFESLGIATVADNDAVIAQSAQVMLAVKPQTLPQIGQSLAKVNADDQVIISIMMGVTTQKIEQAIGHPSRVVRVMPNTPVMCGVGMAAVALGEHARAGDEALAMKLFASAGEAVAVDENELDAITAVSGSGPAYVFYLAEAMERAASELGLSTQARLLVRQTVFGAATLLNHSDDTAGELRRKVTSPGGTTEAAIKHMDAKHCADAIVAAIKAAHARSCEFGRS